MKIDYNGPFDVDFSGNRKLKHIKHSYESDDKINANELKKTWAQTANSLENLRLFIWKEEGESDNDEEGNNDDDEEDLDLDFPKMPKLTSLELLSADDPIVGWNLDQLTPKYLPNLKYLKLGGIGSNTTSLKILQDLVERGSYKHSGIVKLSLSGVQNPLLLKDLKSWFPNLESFEVILPGDKTNYPGTTLENLFKTLKDVKLKILKIVMSFQYDTGELVKALEPNYLQLFDGTFIN
jgi:hypothetical protein